MATLAQTGNFFYVQSNNLEVQESKQAEISGNISKDKINVPGLKTIVGNAINGKDYSNLSVDLFFVDNTQVADLAFKEGNTYTSVTHAMEKWNDENYEQAQHTTSLVYQSGTDGFTAEGLDITKDLGENQIPWVVAEYIQDQIMKSETDALTSIQYCVNVFKNAFDQRFKEKLIEEAPQRINNKEYYRGYAYIPLFLYRIESVVEDEGEELVYYPNMPEPGTTSAEAMSTYVATNYQQEEGGAVHILVVDPTTQKERQAKTIDFMNGLALYYYSLDPLREQEYVKTEINENYLDGVVSKDNSLSGYHRVFVTKRENENSCPAPYFNFDEAIGYSDYAATKPVLFESVEDFTTKKYVAKGSHMKRLQAQLSEIKASEKHFKSWEGVGKKLVLSQP